MILDSRTAPTAKVRLVASAVTTSRASVSLCFQGMGGSLSETAAFFAQMWYRGFQPQDTCSISPAMDCSHAATLSETKVSLRLKL